MTPGDIVMMLNEMGGMRVQATSPSLGAASVRIQGMRGRYTRVLSDGLPLFGEVGGLGLLQIPPMDLGQVEVIKGVASALYGAGAMGGVVNLLSRRPGAEPEARVPAQSLDARRHRCGHLPVRTALARLERLTARRRPLAGDQRCQRRRAGRTSRLLASASCARACSGTAATAARSSRRPASRTRTATAAPRTVECCRRRHRPYVEALETRTLRRRRRRSDSPQGSDTSSPRVRPSRGSATTTSSARCRERDRHDTAFGEVAVRGSRWPSDLGGGTRHRARRLHARAMLPRFDYTFTVPGVFVQDDVTVTPALVALGAAAGSIVHSEYGTFFSPRVSALARAGHWTSRLSVGTGFFAPTPLTEETEAAGLIAAGDSSGRSTPSAE